MHCNKCGKEIPDTAKFCAACGAPVCGRRQTDAVQVSVGRNKEKGKNFNWIIGITAAVLVLAVAAAGIFILATPKRTGFVIKVDVEQGRRYYYKNGKPVTGWFEVDGKRYYGAENKGATYHYGSPFQHEYGQLYDGDHEYVIDGIQYRFNWNGECIIMMKMEI